MLTIDGRNGQIDNIDWSSVIESIDDDEYASGALILDVEGEEGVEEGKNAADEENSFTEEYMDDMMNISMPHSVPSDVESFESDAAEERNASSGI